MIHYMQLGGTLFIPAIHKDLEIVISGKRYKNLKSVVIDTEDSIHSDDVEEALKKIQRLLLKFLKDKLLVFIRPRNVHILQKILKFENIENIDGFVLAKFSLKNADSYLKSLKNTPYLIMPSIEGEELFDVTRLQILHRKLLVEKEKILLVRFGLEDMLRQLKMRRACDYSIFDYSVTSVILGNFLALFKSSGFAVSGGVYPCFKDKEGFSVDVHRDLMEGLFSKTIIHPNQIEIINDLYKVSQKEYMRAKEILDSTENIFSQDTAMAEKQTMSPYSEDILLRAKIYGIKANN